MGAPLYHAYEITFERRRIAESVPLRNASEIAEKLIDLIGDPDRFEEEHVWAIALDTKLNLVAVDEVAKGSVNGGPVRLADLFRLPVRFGCLHLVFAHNHPSGDPTPSPEDLKLWDDARQAGKLLDVEVLDQIILGRDAYYSFFKSQTLPRRR